MWFNKFTIQDNASKVDTWHISGDARRHIFQNDTSRRINRNLWNRLTIDANRFTELKINERKYRNFIPIASDMIRTLYLWDHWMSSLPTRAKSQKLNELVSAIMTTKMGPKKAVYRLNYSFFMINLYFILSRASFIALLHSGKIFVLGIIDALYLTLKQ